MFGWLKKKIGDASTDAMKDDILRFISSLQGANGDEIGMMLVVANIVRLNLTQMGKIPEAALNLDIYRNEDLDYECSKCSIVLVNAIKQFQEINQPTDALGTMIWHHSVRALNTPEIRILGKQMWQELSRGFSHTNQALAEIQLLSDNPLPDNIYEELHFIPKGLE